MVKDEWLLFLARASRMFAYGALAVVLALYLAELGFSGERISISQMDVPTRQSYTMAVVDPDERSAAAGVTSVARSLGAALSPSLAGLLFAAPALASVPFFVAGSLKVAYDLLLYRGFVSRRAPEEGGGATLALESDDHAAR